jgi:ribosome maturation protein Sdo1
LQPDCSLKREDFANEQTIRQYFNLTSAEKMASAILHFCGKGKKSERRRQDRKKKNKQQIRRLPDLR